MLKYISDGTTSSPLSKKIESLVQNLRGRREWRENFMTYEQDMAVRQKTWFNQGREEQRKEDEALLAQKDAELSELKKLLSQHGIQLPEARK